MAAEASPTPIDSKKMIGIANHCAASRYTQMYHPLYLSSILAKLKVMSLSDQLHSRGATDKADHWIALAASLCMHAALIIFVCWPANRANSNAGANRSVGTSDLVVRFISVERASAPQDQPEVIETEPVEEVVKAEEEVVEPIVSDAAMAVEATANLPEYAPAASSSALQQDADGSESGSPGDGDDLEARYVAALRAAIYTQWKQSRPRQESVTCQLVIKQAAGGSVLTAQLVDCSVTPLEQRAFEAAALMAQPLPYTGFESVFTEARTVNVEL